MIKNQKEITPFDPTKPINQFGQLFFDSKLSPTLFEKNISDIKNENNEEKSIFNKLKSGLQFITKPKQKVAIKTPQPNHKQLRKSN